MNFLEAEREEAGKLSPELEMPESIRTPGRTWTRYPELEREELEEVEPDIKVEGDAEVYTGREAVEKAGEKLLDAVRKEENRVHAVHTADMNSLVYIHARDADVSVEYPPGRLHAHLVVEVDGNATVTEDFGGSGEILTSLGEFYVTENASLTYGAIHSRASRFSYASRKAVVDSHGEMNWLNASFGPELSRQRIETVLRGDDSRTEKVGVFYPTGEQHHDLSLHVRHIGERTTCDMKTRGVIDDSSRAVYEGLQKVEKTAADTSSFQRENTLTLSEDAEVDSSPKLKIENNDVEASHAASAGRLDEEELYYMESRGLEEEDARNLAVKGFFEPVVQDIELPDLKKRMRKQIEQKLEG